MIGFWFELFLCEIFVKTKNLNNITIALIALEFYFSTLVMIMQNDNRQNCPIKELPDSLYNLMLTPFGLFVKSQCGARTTMQQCVLFFFLVWSNAQNDRHENTQTSGS